jgi:Cu-Zn family superoxide dismutase
VAATSPSAGGEALAAQLKAPDGRQVATATFDFSNGYVTVTVKTVAAGILAPGFHGLHVLGRSDRRSAR